MEMKILYNTINPEINDVNPVVVCPCCLEPDLDSKYTKTPHRWVVKTHVWLMQYANTEYVCPKCKSRWCSDDVVMRRKLRKRSIAIIILSTWLILLIGSIADIFAAGGINNSGTVTRAALTISVMLAFVVAVVVPLLWMLDKTEVLMIDTYEE